MQINDLPYVWALSFTPGRSWVLGVESKFVLNKVSIIVDLPIPVSPEIMHYPRLYKFILKLAA